MNKYLLLSVIALSITSCTASQHYNSLHSNAERKVTVGNVQKNIKKGMPASEVADVMGSPNIVTSDGPNAESWIYDKIATEVSYSKSSQGADMMVFGLGPLRHALLGAGAGANINSQTGASAQNQRTLTVIIKFVNNVVSDFKYHTSSF